VAPLLPHLDLSAPPTVFGVSGYSGAGTKAGEKTENGRPATLPKVSPEELSGGIKPYSLTDHIHEREAARHLSRLLPDGATVQPAFIPTVAPWFSGIISVLSAPLKIQMDARNVRQLYEEKYRSEKLLTVQNNVPVLPEIEGHHGWRVGGFQVHSSGKRAVVVVGKASAPK
jgi:N-acetyl-gamma-glutamyl-phosphate reductase/acetylglutamate kinase